MSDFPAIRPPDYPQNPFSMIMGKIPPPAGVAPQPAQFPAENSLDFAHSILAMVNKKALQDGSYDSTEDFNKLQQALLKASTAKSPYELQADNALLQATEENKLADWMKNNPLAPPEQYKAAESVPLSLPGVPTNVQPHPNGLASFGAGIAGLFAPRAAGRFGAEALSGAIQAAQRENAAKREKYQFDLQQSLVKHQDAVREADAKARVEAQNTALKNTYSAEQHNDNLKTAVERMNAAVKSGEAGNLRKFIEGNRPAEEAKAQAQFLEQKIKTSSEQAKEALDRAAKAAELQLKIQEQQDIATNREKDRLAAQAETDRKNREDERIRNENLLRQQKEDKERDRDRTFREGMENRRLGIESGHLSETERHDRAMEDRAASSARGGTMYHKGPLEISAEKDMNYNATLAQKARAAADAVSPDNDTAKAQAERKALAAEARYNKSRENLINVTAQEHNDEDMRRGTDSKFFTDPTTGRLKRRLPTAPGTATMRYNPQTGQVEVIR
jgi:hypothetical protein